MTFFKRVWQIVKVLSRPWASRPTLVRTRPLKWGTWRLWTPSGSKNTSRQSWRIDVLVLKRTFSIVQLWRLIFLEPLRVKRHYVSHFKGLISAKVELEAQGRDSTFTICHTLLKKAILHYKRALASFVLSTTVSIRSPAMWVASGLCSQSFLNTWRRRLHLWNFHCVDF